MRKLFFVALALGCASAASAQTPTPPNMKCAAYLQAETASGWSEGVTGQPRADKDQQKTTQLHDFCAGHPDSTIAEADQAGNRTR